MIEVEFDPSFKKVFKKRIRNQIILEKKFWQKVQLFINDPFHRNLKTHKLSGKLKNLLSFTIDYDCRVIFYFKTSSKAVFVDIGTHDEV